MSDAAPTPSREDIRTHLVAMICEITRRSPDEIGEVSDATPCVGGDMLSDSLDVLEFVVALEREFSVAIRDGESGQQILVDLGTLTDLVQAARA